MPSLRAVLTAVMIAAAAQPAAAIATWSHTGTGTPAAKAVSMPTGSTPTTSVSNRSVTVSWSASTMPGGGAVSGYTVKRYDTNGNVQTIGSGCSGTVSALTCTETSVPGGSWRYSVTPLKNNWIGGESSQSTAATVASPSLSFSSSTTVTSLPTTLNGTIAAFVGGQTVTYRLDNSSTGTVLSGTLSPTPVPSGGGSSVTVTIPSGTSNGSHTVYAVGSAGDVASATITVSAGFTTTTSAYDLRDASSGTEANKSFAPAFAGDALTFTTALWPIAFNNANYLEFDPNAPLQGGSSVTGANFNLTYAAASKNNTACYWFQVWSVSTNSVIASHGSQASPADCTTGTTLKSVSTALAEVSTTDIANDIRVRVYGRESGGNFFTIDRATVSGTAGSMPFTLYDDSYTDAADGSAASTDWGIAASGGSTYSTASVWATSFATARYLKFTFPGYVPSGATVTGATFKMNYRPNIAGSTHNACYYFEVWSGTQKLGSHGTITAPFGCNSTSTYQPDSVPLPEITTPAQANSAFVKVFFRVSSSATKTDHDLVQLSVNYQ